MEKRKGKSTTKKSSGTTKRKAGAGKSTARKAGRTGGASSRSAVKKGKISLSPTKVIWLCCAVIVICLALLLVTSVGDKKKVPAITERFEKEENTPEVPVQKEEKIADTKSEQNGKKSDVKQGTQSEKKSETKSNKQNGDKSSAKSNTQNGSQTAQKQSAQNVSESKPSVTVAPSESELVAKKQTEKKDKTVVAPPAPKPVESTFNFPAAVNHAELIFVFDDGGQNLNQLQPFLELPIPITVAVLPKLPHSAETAARVRKSGNEVMLHQPMQAINSNVNPGPGAIKPEMTALEISELVQSNIDEIAPIAGMNNHEGSLITADALKIGVVLDVADKNGIFFLDSRTNVETKVPEVSKKSGYSWYERNGRFLDNEKTREEFLTELRKNLDIANKSGSVIMIGHIWSADYLPALIREVYPELKEKGYTFKTVSGSSAKKN